MTGTILGRKATLPVTLLLPGQPRLTMEFVLDTGYEGALTLPIAAILWNDATWEVPVLAMGKRPLLGTLLLENHDIAMHFADGGTVEIRPF